MVQYSLPSTFIHYCSTQYTCCLHSGKSPLPCQILYPEWGTLIGRAYHSPPTVPPFWSLPCPPYPSTPLHHIPMWQELTTGRRTQFPTWTGHANGTEVHPRCSTGWQLFLLHAGEQVPWAIRRWEFYVGQKVPLNLMCNVHVYIFVKVMWIRNYLIHFYAESVQLFNDV